MIDLTHGEALHRMSLMQPQSIDLIYCDLPYGTTQCSWDSVIPFDAMWSEVERLIKPNCAIVFHAQQPFTSSLIMSRPRLFKYGWVWHKSKATGFLNAKKRPLVAHEDILVFCKGTPPYYPQMTVGEPYNKGIRKQQTDNDVYGVFDQVEVKSSGSRYPRSVVYFKTAESEGAVIHKAQKPVALCEYIIRTYSKEGDTVLDFTMGSGRSAIAAHNTGRKYIGIEIDARIFAKASANIKSLTTKQ